jgi:hypothetical protein
MHGAISMASLVSNDLPLGGGAYDNISTCYRLSATARVALRSISASLSKPSKPNSGAGIARAEECPVRILVALLSSPLGELVQAILDGDAAAAGLVPWSSLLLRGRTVWLSDDEVGKTEGDVEGALKKLRCLVDSVDDVLLGLVLISVEGLNVGAICSDTHERHLARRGAPGRAADC